MTFADIYFYFVLAAPYAGLPFFFIYFALRWRSRWTMGLPTIKMFGGLVLSVILATLVVSGINFSIALNYPDRILFMMNEIQPVGDWRSLAYPVTGVLVSSLIWMRLKSDIKVSVLKSEEAIS